MANDYSPLEELWWTTPAGNETHNAALADFQSLQDGNRRQDRFATYERIYRNEGITESNTLEAELAAFGSTLAEYTRPSYNLIATVTDNIVARIVRNKPRAIYQVDGANWSLRRVAKQQQKWVDFVAHSGDFAKHAREQVRDGVLLGTGLTKIYKKPNVDEIGICRVHPADVFVDGVEVTYGEPTRMFERRFISKDSAKRMFLDKADVLEDSAIISERDYQDRQQFNSTPSLAMTELVECWRLPSWVKDGKTSGDGKHIIFCSAGVLFEEEWKRSDFPILRFEWQSRPSDSFNGLSVPEQILGLHLDLNFTLQMIHEAAELTPSPIILTPQSAKLSRDEITNLPCQVWEYVQAGNSAAPQVVQNPKIQADLVNYASEIEARAYRRLGLDSATPNAPSPGLETGAAVRADFDTRSMAFSTALQNFEALYKEFGDKAVSAGREIYEGNKSFSVVVPKDRYTVEDVPWEDIDLDQRGASYTVKVSVGSALSQHPAGRIDDVANLVNMGAVSDQSEIRALTDLPDLKHSNDLATAARDAVEHMCESMLDDGVEHMPEPYDDLDLCMSITNAYYLRARSMGAPEDRLDIMRRFLDRTSALISKRDLQRAAQAQGIVPGGGTPPAPDAQGQNPAAIQGI